jgi:glycosyltransferase involved in cell wall biosynthesis
VSQNLCKPGVVLRVTPSFSSLELPGSGLNAYYHSALSKNKSYVLTEDRLLTLRENNKYNIIKIKKRRFQIKHGSNLFVLCLSMFKKLFQILSFSLSAVIRLRNLKPDIVHCYTPTYLPVGYFFKIFNGSKLFISFHGTDILTLKKLHLTNFVAKTADCVLLIAESMSATFHSKYQDKIIYIGNGYDKEIFKNNLKKRTKQIICVGGLRWQKGFDIALKIFAASRLHKKGFTLVIVGEGPLKSFLKNLSISLGICDFVIFKSNLSQSDLSNLFNESYCLAITSVSEGSPKVVIEAMACGLPILGTNVGDIKKLVSEFGYVESDESKLASNLKKICNTEWDREKISYYANNFQWKNVVERVDNAYNRPVI